MALAGTITPEIWLLAMIPFCQVNNLLLLNQFPDVEADRQSGRVTFPIQYGARLSSIIYAIQALIPFVLITVLITQGVLPTSSFIALIGLPIAVFISVGAFKHGFSIANHPQFLAANVALTLITSFIVAITLL
ncbi:prenyltransferase [Colwellia sp. MEBiC06753]